MEQESKDTLTSVKVNKELFDEFKINCVRLKFSLNKLTNRTMFLFQNDPAFRKQLMDMNDRDLIKK